MSCQPRRVGFVSPEESMRLLSILVSTPTVMVAMITRRCEFVGKSDI